MAPPFKTINSPLTYLQARFVKEYLLDPSSQERAAKRAGYSLNTCSAVSSLLMKDPRIQKAISEGQSEVIDKTGITKERIILELAKIAFANIGDVIKVDPLTGKTQIDPDKFTKNNTAALQEFSVTTGSRGTTIKVKQSDKIAALMGIGKHLGMFNDKLEISGNMSLTRLIEDSFKDSPRLPPIIDTTYEEVSQDEGNYDSEDQLELPL